MKADSEGTSTKGKKAAGGKKRVNKRWVTGVLFAAVFISMALSFASSAALSNAGYVLAFLVLLVFILIGILFDILGVAVTSAEEAPFHSMAAHKERGGAEAIRLIKNAEKVSSICNDVVGDISGIISGASAAIIVSRLTADLRLDNVILQLVMSGAVAGITIGGKAAGKTLAINQSTRIVYFAARLISYKNDFFAKFRRKKKGK